MIEVISNLSHGLLRLAHGWRLAERSGVSAVIIRDFIRPAVRAVPRALAARLKICRISLPSRLSDAALSSQWVQTTTGVDIAVASQGIDGHELALELLLCLGQALWEVAFPGEREAYLKLLGAEIEASVAGEIDEEARREKRALFSSPHPLGAGLVSNSMLAHPLRAQWPSTFTASGMTSPCGAAASICLQIGSDVA